MKNIEVIEKFINGCIGSGGNLTSTSDRLFFRAASKSRGTRRRG